MIDKIKEIAEKHLSEIKYLPGGMMTGFLATIFTEAGVPKTNPIPKEYFETVEDAVYDITYNGCEPEFNTEDEYDSFNKLISKLNSNYYIYITEDSELRRYNQRSPYKDKSIPYLFYHEK